MRIIAGELKGRVINRPKSRLVRPMADQFREALFNIVHGIDGAFVLDVYAGSGAAGFEALSRGAAEVDAVEVSAQAARVITANASQLGISGRYHLYNKSVESWLKADGGIKPGYDLVVADPPYQQLDGEIIQKLADLLVPEGTLALSHSSRLSPPELKSVSLAGTRQYGDSALTLYIKK